MDKKANTKKNKFRTKSPLKDLKLRKDQANKVQGGVGINTITIAPGPEN
jgi:hypothetical protein